MQRLTLIVLLLACGERRGRSWREPGQRCNESCLATLDQRRPPQLAAGFGYRTCEGLHIVETPGDHPIATDDLVAFNRRHGFALVQPGPGASMGIGGCCPAEPGAQNVICLAAMLNPCTTSMETVLARLTTALRKEGLANARVTIELAFSFCNPELL